MIHFTCTVCLLKFTFYNCIIIQKYNPTPTFVWSRNRTALLPAPRGTSPSLLVRSWLRCQYRTLQPSQGLTLCGVHEVLGRAKAGWCWQAPPTHTCYKIQNSPFICGEETSSSFLTHNSHHLLQSEVTCTRKCRATRMNKAWERVRWWVKCVDMKSRSLTAYSSNDEDLLGAAVSHGTFRDLHQHGEECLL